MPECPSEKARVYRFQKYSGRLTEPALLVGDFVDALRLRKAMKTMLLLSCHFDIS